MYRANIQTTKHRMPYSEAKEVQVKKRHWKINVHDVIYWEFEGYPFTKTIAPPLVTLDVVTDGTNNNADNVEDRHDLQVMYLLTQPGNALEEFLHGRPNGKYQLVLFKQAHNNIGLPQDKIVYMFAGHTLITKNKDVIFWETRKFQIGMLNKYNLQTRDIQEEVKRSNYSKLPGTGLDQRV